ncbi:hypothetical protein Ocin01_08146 [Orchesella cincta]|uniref:Uncharacterized protein n=1 Tax=Orchesella cincta TaxID=48709 RepID=A0A1D2N0E1_ORCCI|nr:hypothetical protein Ocin01_08146 [Orchesella cincta]
MELLYISYFYIGLHTNALRSNRKDQAYVFYKKLQTKENAFDPLVSLLTETNQSGAVRLLKQGLRLESTSTSNIPNENEPDNSMHHDSDSTIWNNAKVFDSTEVVITEDEAIPEDTLRANETTVMVTQSVVVKQPALLGADEFDGTVPATKPTTAVPEILAPKETTWMVTERDFTSETNLPNSNSSEFNITVLVSKPAKNVTAILAGDETIYFTKPALISEITVNSANFSIYESTAYAIKLTTKVPTFTTQRITYVPNSINRCDINVLEKDDEQTSMLFKVCPDSKECPCWGDSARRDVHCKEWNYQERWEIQNFGFYTCYCCGKY